jgi:Flp pilus assembly pilin Flp
MLALVTVAVISSVTTVGTRARNVHTTVGNTLPVGS